MYTYIYIYIYIYVCVCVCVSTHVLHAQVFYLFDLRVSIAFIVVNVGPTYRG